MCYSFSFSRMLLIRLLGAIVLGPHMYFVGKSVLRSREQQEEAAERFYYATDQVRAEMLAQERIRLHAEADEQLQKELERDEDASTSTSSRRLRQNGFSILKMYPNAAARRLKFLCEPDLTRSTAVPKGEAFNRESSQRMISDLSPGFHSERSHKQGRGLDLV